MSLKTTNLKSWSQQKYVVAVLWMEGRLGTADIAKQVRWTGGQVKGFYCREFTPPRDHMTRDDRQEILNLLKEHRSWFGVFVDTRFDDRFRAKELRGAAAARAHAQRLAPTAGTEPEQLSKKDMKRASSEAAAQARKDERDRIDRESGFAPRGSELDALAWLYANALGDRNEVVAKGAMLSRDRRKEAMLKFRQHLSGRTISPLQAQDYEAVGGGGGQKIALPEYRKFCIDMITGVREIMAADQFQIMERIVDKEEFVWLQVSKGSARGIVYETIRRSADALAVYYQMMSRDDFYVRWGQSISPSSLPSRSAARADSALTQEVIDQLVKATA